MAEAAIKNAGPEAIAAMRAQGAKAFGRLTKGAGIVGVLSTSANLAVGNISGPHATAQYIIAAISFSNPALGLALGLIDTFLGDEIFGDNKKN